MYNNNNYSNPYNNNNNTYGYNTAPYTNYIPPAQINPATTNTNKIFVSGIEDARGRYLPPNSDMMFLDNDKPIIYQKIVDSKGQFEVKAYDIVPHTAEQPKTTMPDLSQYVLKSDFDKLLSEIDKFKAQLEMLGGTTNESNEQQ